MKITDDYTAKFKIWAKEGKVYPLAGVSIRLPGGVRSVSFRSYEELNAWKKDLIRAAASRSKE